MASIEKIRRHLEQVEQSAQVKLTYLQDLSLTNLSYLCEMEGLSYKRSAVGEKPKVVVKLWGNIRKHGVSEWLQPLLTEKNYPTPKTIASGVILLGENEIGYTISEYEPYPQAESVLEQWSQVEQCSVYRTAGEWLHRLHGLFSFPQPGIFQRDEQGQWRSESNWSASMIKEIERWLEPIDHAARGQQESGIQVSMAERDLFFRQYEKYVAVVDQELSGKNIDIVLCHRDYHARNWLADPQERKLAAIIDFEHMFAGDPLFDFQRVHSYCLLQNRTDLWHAFLDGYGVKPEEIERRSFLYVLNYGLGSAGYAVKVNDAPFYHQAMQLLRFFEQAQPFATVSRG